MEKIIFEHVDAYHDAFEGVVRARLDEMRAILRDAVPDAQEVISYGMPALKWKKILVYYAGYKGHIGFYPHGSGIEAFKHAFGTYKFSKGAVQFPLHEPLPEELIRRIVAFRKEEVEAGLP